MAANTIEYLKHGKALCGKVFAAFVETFNWHNDFCKNLKGDADLPGKAGATGRITVDRTDPSNPIIRFESPYVSNGEDPEEKPEPEEPEDPYVPPTDEPENPDDGKSGVTSLNGATGAVTIIGGSGIRVSRNGNVITISFVEGKEPDPDPSTDPCEHPEGGAVPAGGEDDFDGGGGGGFPAGGVPAGGDSHAGDGCTSEKCN